MKMDIGLGSIRYSATFKTRPFRLRNVTHGTYYLMNAILPSIGLYDASDTFSGLTRYVLAIANSLDQREFRVTLFCRKDGPYKDLSLVNRVFLPESSNGSLRSNGPDLTHSPWSERWLRNSWRRISPRGLKLWAGYFRDFESVASFLRSHRIDLFHTQLVGADPTPLAARLAGIKTVLGTFHINCHAGGFPDHVLEIVTNHCLDTAIAVGSRIKEDWIQRTLLRESKVVTIPNAVDANWFRRRENPQVARRARGSP